MNDRIAVLTARQILIETQSLQDARQLPQKVLKLAMDETGAESGSIFLLEDEKIVIKSVAFPGSFPEVMEYKVAKAMQEGLAGWAFRQQQGALCTDTATDPRWMKFGDDGDEVGSAIAMPFVFMNEVIAMMTLHHNRRRYFHEFHLAVAADIAIQTAGLMEAFRARIGLKKQANDITHWIGNLNAPVMLLDGKGLVRFQNEVCRQRFGLEDGVSITELDNGPALVDAIRIGEDAQVELKGRSYRVVTRHVKGMGQALLLEAC
jgi:transcriptional regulator with GAF, ATPase, and Fis domain